MEKRAILAFVLCMLVFLVWMQIFGPPVTSPEPDAANGEKAVEAPEKPLYESDIPTQYSKPSPVPMAEVPVLGESDVELEDNNITIETDVFTTVWSNRGAALKSLIFKGFYSDVSKTELLTFLDEIQKGEFSLTMQTNSAMVDLEQRVWAVERPDAVTLRFTTTLPNKLVVSKIITFEDGKFDFGIEIQVTNPSDRTVEWHYTFQGAAGVVPDSQQKGNLNAAVVTEGGGASPDWKRKRPDQLVKKPYEDESAGEILWVVVENKYFASALRPRPASVPWVAAAKLTSIVDTELRKDLVDKAKKESGGVNEGSAKKIKAKSQSNATARIVMRSRDIPSGQSISDTFYFFAGPKDVKELAAYDDFNGFLNYGMFGFISKILLSVLALLHKIFRNYGVAIIILTCLTKGLLFPLSKKQQVSMAKMQKLQPLINELKEKHGEDRQKFGQDQMALFKKHGVNPLGGCLPMFLQIPIFFGLYWGLRLSISLRQQPFFFWIKDLAEPDTVAQLPFVIPLAGTSNLNILPIVMTGMWIVQQQMMPKSKDPQQKQQQKIMMLMPLVIAFMLYNMPSGLILYWLTSNFLGIVEQWYIKRHYIRHIQELPFEELKVSAGNKKGKSGSHGKRKKKRG